MRCLCLSLALLFMSTAAADDQQAIQGTWHCLTVVPSAKSPLGKDELEVVLKMTLTFNDKSVTMKREDTNDTGSFTLDTSASPKRLVLKEEDRILLKAVYVLEKDLLVITFNEGDSDFPKALSVTNDLKGGMLVMQKAPTGRAGGAVKPGVAPRPVATQLKQLGLAVHNYLSAMNVMPRNITDKAGKPLLSWRIHLLPYLEQEALYRQFKLDEPWDSEHNKALIAKMPKVFAVDANDEKNHTSALRPFEGKGAAWEAGKDLRVSHFTDGLSNTLMLVEAADAEIWTKPSDLPFGEGKPLPKLSGRNGNTVAAVLMDGFVIAIPGTINEATLRGIITRDGGEIMAIPDLNRGYTQRTFDKVEMAKPPEKK